MKRLIPVLPYFYSSIVLLGFYVLQIHPELIWYIFILLLLLLIAVWLLTIGFANISREQSMIFFTPLFFVASGFGFFILSDHWLLQLLVALLTFLGSFILLRSVYFYHRRSAKYQPFSLQTQSQYLNIVTVFFVTSLFYAFETFLSFSLLYSGPILFVMIFALYWQMIYLQKLKKEERVYVGIFSFILAQYFVVVGLLPFLVYVKGFLFTVGFYVFHELYTASIRGFWRKTEVLRLVGIAIGIAAIVLITTKWF